MPPTLEEDSKERKIAHISTVKELKGFSLSRRWCAASDRTSFWMSFDGTQLDLKSVLQSKRTLTLGGKILPGLECGCILWNRCAGIPESYPLFGDPTSMQKV